MQYKMSRPSLKSIVPTTQVALENLYNNILKMVVGLPIHIKGDVQVSNFILILSWGNFTQKCMKNSILVGVELFFHAKIWTSSSSCEKN